MLTVLTVHSRVNSLMGYGFVVVVDVLLSTYASKLALQPDSKLYCLLKCNCEMSLSIILYSLC